MVIRRTIFDKALWIAVLGLLSPLAGSDARADMITKQVRVVYLTPSDKAYRPEYELALGTAVTDLQGWFADQLGGSTFSTPSDSVAWYQTSHPSSWYQANPSNPSFYAGRFWESALADAFALTGGRFNDPDDRWLFYIDADPLAGQYTGGTSAVALFPANDLRGLNGEPPVPINRGDPTVNPGFSRWVGGMGHELGHAFGLGHPVDSPGGRDDYALMYLGYLTYPDTYLRASDKTALLASGFFAPVSVPEPGALALLASGLLPLAGIALIRRRTAGTKASPQLPNRLANRPGWMADRYRALVEKSSDAQIGPRWRDETRARLHGIRPGLPAVLFGTTGSQPVPGDYDGNGRADVAVYDPTSGILGFDRIRRSRATPGSST